MHFVNVDLAEDILLRDIPRFQKQQFGHVILKIKSLAKFKGAEKRCQHI